MTKIQIVKDRWARLGHALNLSRADVFSDLEMAIIQRRSAVRALFGGAIKEPAHYRVYVMDPATFDMAEPIRCATWQEAKATALGRMEAAATAILASRA